MLIHDYSTRRGVLVPLLEKVHAMYRELAEHDKLSGLAMPEHIITWTQKRRKELVDIERRFFVALDGGELVGFFFYKHEGENILLEDVQGSPEVIEGFLKKLEYDTAAKDKTFYAGERIRRCADEEIVALRKGAKPRSSDCSVDVLRETQNINLVGISPRSLDSGIGHKKAASPLVTSAKCGGNVVTNSSGVGHKKIIDLLGDFKDMSAALKLRYSLNSYK